MEKISVFIFEREILVYELFFVSYIMFDMK